MTTPIRNICAAFEKMSSHEDGHLKTDGRNIYSHDVLILQRYGVGVEISADAPEQVQEDVALLRLRYPQAKVRVL